MELGSIDGGVDGGHNIVVLVEILIYLQNRAIFLDGMCI